MNSRLQNHLSMIGACITVAQHNDHKAVWTGNPPADFAADLAQLTAAYGAITSTAAQADAATTGAADAKAVAETTLEDAAFVLARALAVHFKKTGDLAQRAKIDFTRSEIQKLRDQELVNQSTAIRDIAQAATSQPGATGSGVTAARIATLSAAIAAFNTVMSTPRGQIVNRSVLLREVETDVAALLESLTTLDDLVLQFDGTDAGKRFNEAWKRARIIVDAGTGHSEKPAPTPQPPTPPPGV